MRKKIKYVNIQKTVKGNMSDMLVARKNDLERNRQELQTKIVDPYTGGLAVGIASVYDKMGNSIGAVTVIAGVDRPETLLRMAFSVKEASDTLIDMAKKATGKDFAQTVAKVMADVMRESK